MPIRIKPELDLGPCQLNLDSVQGIANLLTSEFSSVSFSATDHIWEIFDETKRPFLNAISGRKKLDAFIVTAEETTATNQVEKKIRIVFSDTEASVCCEAHPDQQNWFEHFLIDLEKFVLPPSIYQLAAHAYSRYDFTGLFPLVISSVARIPWNEFAKPSRNPYCRIILRRDPPDPFWVNIKANLVSNIIWAILGATVLLIAQWLLQTFGVDINPFN